MVERHFVYILECRDKTLYTGWTKNLNKRLEKHNSGKGAKYTRGRTPCKLVYYSCFPTKSLALKEEARIKKLKKNQKIKLSKNLSILPVQ